MPNRLFMVQPGEVYANPPEFGQDYDGVPVGPIEGWEAYAPNMGRFESDKIVVGPFTAVVQEDGFGKFIEVPGADPGVRFYFGRDSDNNDARTNPYNACWHQSGSFLRFIRKRSGEWKPPGRVTHYLVKYKPGRHRDVQTVTALRLPRPVTHDEGQEVLARWRQSHGRAELRDGEAMYLDEVRMEEIHLPE